MRVQPKNNPSAPTNGAAQGIDLPGLLDLLAHGSIRGRQDIPWGSNYTFLVQIEKAPLRALAIYKPQRGEAPLSDFRAGTLCYREYVAYLVSAALDWWLVPPTVLRDGPHGQRWGNPLYRWDKMKRGGFAWWVQRVRRALAQADVFRIDHFRGRPSP